MCIYYKTYTIIIHVYTNATYILRDLYYKTYTIYTVRLILRPVGGGFRGVRTNPPDTQNIDTMK